MRSHFKALAIAGAIALALTLGGAPTAAADDVPPVKRVSCPTVDQVNAVTTPPSVTGRVVTPTTCEYTTSGTTSLSFFFSDSATVLEDLNRIRDSWPPDYPYPFQPVPLPGLGPDAFYWADASPGMAYWQFAPGAVAHLVGPWGPEDMVPMAKLFRPMMEVYTIAGDHDVNGRQWRTTCEPYSATVRCYTDIFATVIKQTPTGYVSVNDWAFNSLTYRWAPRALWVGNNLARNASWTSTDGRQWRTECDTVTTGRGACRSYINATVISRQGDTYVQNDTWLFNNQVLFSD